MPHTPTTERAYRALVGLGSAQIGLFRGGIYVGHQGTETGTGTAGGLIFGGKIIYYPTHRLTIATSVDEIFNNSSQTTTTLAVNPADLLSVVSIPTSASTRTSAFALRADYVLTALLTAYAAFGYTRVDYLDTVELDNSWLGAVGLVYNIRPNWGLTLDYRHTQVVSNVPNVAFVRDYVGLGVRYAFRPLL